MNACWMDEWMFGLMGGWKCWKVAVGNPDGDGQAVMWLHAACDGSKGNRFSLVKAPVIQAFTVKRT